MTTPLPWTIVTRTDSLGVQTTSIEGPGHSTVCDNEGYYPVPVDPDDQRLIVLAVNHHQELLDACKAGLDLISYQPRMLRQDHTQIIEQMRTIIHKVETQS